MEVGRLKMEDGSPKYEDIILKRFNNQKNFRNVPKFLVFLRRPKKYLKIIKSDKNSKFPTN
ncbi:MAG TPA: hypothetical protein DIS75_04975, partial [Chryseobacterium sp.]|nr:hypothetical protein [Chryseobacterium sp.]